MGWSLVKEKPGWAAQLEASTGEEPCAVSSTGVSCGCMSMPLAFDSQGQRRCVDAEAAEAKVAAREKATAAAEAAQEAAAMAAKAAEAAAKAAEAFFAFFVQNDLDISLFRLYSG